jgi:mannosyltransferase
VFGVGGGRRGGGDIGLPMVPAPVSWSALCAITALAFGLRLYRLGHQSLWMDEVLTATNAAHPLRQLLFDSSVDHNFPPLYTALIHLSQQWLGLSDVVLRLPSALAGTLSVPVLYAGVRAELGERTALVSALLFAISPFHVWYSQEARPYALLVLLGLTALWCAARFVERPDSRARLATFVLAAAAAFYCHLVAAPLLLVLAGYLLARVPRAGRPAAVAGILGLGVLLLPQVLEFVSTPPLGSGNPDYRFNPAHVGYTAWAFATGYSLGPSLLELREGMQGLKLYLWLIVPIMLLLGAIAVLGARTIWRDHRATFWLLVAWIVGPIAFAVAGAITTAHPYNVRYAILAMPAALVLLGSGLLALKPLPIKILSSLAVIAMSATGLINYYSAPKYHREDNRAAARFLNANASRGDVVVASAPYTALPLRYYRLRDDLKLVRYPDTGMVSQGRPLRDLDPMLRGRERVWLFLSRTFHSDPGGEIVKYMDSAFMLRQEFTAAGVRVLLYSRRRDPLPTGPK